MDGLLLIKIILSPESNYICQSLKHMPKGCFLGLKLSITGVYT